MPKGNKRSRSEDKPAAPVDEIDRELAEAEAEAAGAQEASAPEAAEEKEEPAPRSTRRRGATLRVVATGPAEEVRESLGEFGAGSRNGNDDAEPEEDEEEIEEDEDEAVNRFMKLLSSPKYFITVTRELPRKHNGYPCTGKLPDTRYNCPASFEDIKNDIFERFGGEVFMLEVHPKKPNGEAVTVDALTVRNPDTKTPYFEGREIGVPEIEPTEDTAEPAMAEDDPDPLRKIEAELVEQARVKSRISRLKTTRQIMKEMDNDDEVKPARDDSRVQQLEKRISDMTMEQRMDKRMEKLENLVLQIAEGGAGRKGAGEDSNMKLLIAMMQSSDQKFQTMMTTFMPLLVNRGAKTDDLDSSLARLAKLKEVMGGENSKLKSIESKIMEKMLDRFLDGDEGGSDGEGGLTDVARTAIKEFAPIAKTLVDNKTAPPQGVSQEEFKRAVVAEAQRISQTTAFRDALANDLAKRGMLIKMDAQPQLPVPTQQPAKAAPAAQAAPKEETKEVAVQDEEDAEPPPSPQSDAYDRKLAVNFVLDTFLREMVTQREDGFALGDVLDRLDEEILRGLLSVGDAEGLKRLIGPHADPAKLEAITNAAKANPAISDWLSRVILGAKQAYREQLEKAGAIEREEAK